MRTKSIVLGAVTIILTLLFSAVAALTPLATSYAFTHTVFGESATATW